jgi:hypothetical protein
VGAAFGEARVIAASADSKKLMKQLVTKGLFDEQRDIWRLGAALGISAGEVHRPGARSTFQNVNSLDPEEVFAAVMLGRYPKLTPEERLKMLVDHAEWGIREISRRVANGTFSPASYAVPVESSERRPKT